MSDPSNHQPNHRKPPKQKAGKSSKCPICNEPADPQQPAFPFCSKRCRMIDLGRWLGEQYTISRPIEQSDLEEGE